MRLLVAAVVLVLGCGGGNEPSAEEKAKRAEALRRSMDIDNGNSTAAPQAPNPAAHFEPGAFKAAFILGRDGKTVNEALVSDPTDDGPGKKRYVVGDNRFIVVTFSRGVAVRLAVLHPDVESPPLSDIVAWLSVENPDPAMDFVLKGKKYITRHDGLRTTLMTEATWEAAERKVEEKREAAERQVEEKRRATIAADVRRSFASTVQQKLLDAGIEASVTTRGRDASTLRIQSYMCSLVFLNEFSKSPLFDDYRDKGFTCLRCNDSIQGDYTMGCGNR